MERIAFISDIHSNLPALQSTLKDIKERGISRIYCLGDIVGYHSFPNEAVELIKASGIISIKGNHDEARTLGVFDSDSMDGLIEENCVYLKHLPDFLEFHIEDVSIDLVHGSPDSNSEYIREDSEEADKYFKTMTGDVLICGHTHIPYISERDGKYMLNTGSVGKPKFGKPDASYIILTVDGTDIKPEIITVTYPV